MKLDAVIAALHQAWSAETSASPDWTPANPSLGQCSVSACVIQDYCGGEILNCTVTFSDGATGSHYVNLIDGKIVDTTVQQFPSDATMTKPRPKTGRYSSTREYCLSYDSTRRRYELLKASVRAFLDRPL